VSTAVITFGIALATGQTTVHIIPCLEIKIAWLMMLILLLNILDVVFVSGVIITMYSVTKI